MKNGSLKTASVVIGMLVLFASVVGAWTDMKNKTSTNEKNHQEFKQETRENIKEIKADQKETLVQMTRALTILEELRSN